MMRLLLFIALFLPAIAAAEATLIRTWPGNLAGITREAGVEWGLNDYSCAFSVEAPDPTKRKPKGELLACGQVIRVTQRGIIVLIAGSRRAMNVGDKFEMRKVTSSYYYGSGLMDMNYLSSIDPWDQQHLGLGMNWNSPHGNFEQGVSYHISVGFQATYIPEHTVGLGTLQGWGYLFNVNYYNKSLYKGFWAQGGLGLAFIRGKASTGTQEFRGSFLMSGSVGWRFLINNRWTVGLGLGAQYFFGNTFQRFNLGFSGLLPVAYLQLGIKF